MPPAAQPADNFSIFIVGSEREQRNESEGVNKQQNGVSVNVIHNIFGDPFGTNHETKACARNQHGSNCGLVTGKLSPETTAAAMARAECQVVALPP